jgi:hypothetical protein
MIGRYSIAMILGLSAAFVATGRATADEIRDKFKSLAKEVLENTHEQSVSVGQFTPVGLPHANAGVGLEQLLREALEAIHAGIVQTKAQYEVKADYALVSSELSHDMKEIKFALHIFNTDSGEELNILRSRVQVRLSGTNTIALITGITASVPPNGTKEERNKVLQKAHTSPSVFIHGHEKTLVSCSESSPYAVELLVKPLNSEGTLAPRPAYEQGGLAFVDIQRDELYQVKIYNNSGKPVAITLTIDGLDVFHFSKDRDKEGRPLYKRFICAGKTRTIQGWFDTLQNAYQFLVTEYGKGAVSQAGVISHGQVGVIHVAFAECREIKPGAKGRGGNETGIGPPIKVNLKPVHYEFENPHEFVTIRYSK